VSIDLDATLLEIEEAFNGSWPQRPPAPALLFDLSAIRLEAVETDDPFVGTEIIAVFACGCLCIWWADYTRGKRYRCPAHRA
jgi:hypothetical protein